MSVPNDSVASGVGHTVRGATNKRLEKGFEMLTARELDQESTSKPVGVTRWIVIACTFLIAAVSYLDRNNVSIAAS
jgi:hypothetical protein